MIALERLPGLGKSDTANPRSATKTASLALNIHECAQPSPLASAMQIHQHRWRWKHRQSYPARLPPFCFVILAWCGGLTLFN